MGGLAGRTLFITGGSRGIGLAIGLRAARDGANVAVAAKTVEPDPRLPGTIFTAAAELERAGGKALPLACDIRDEAAVRAAVARTVETFGGIDVLVNNASALGVTGTLDTTLRRFDLMQQVNVRGTWLCSQVCLPHLERSTNPHVLALAPPLNLDPRWFAGHTAYTISKYGMSMCVLGMAEEFRRRGLAFNALWPRTVIATSAVKNLLGGEQVLRGARRPEIVADAAYEILGRPSRECTGNFFIDEEVLAAAGVTDFGRYAVEPGVPLIPDFFL